MTNLHFDITEDQLTAEYKNIKGFKSCQIIWDKQNRSTGKALIDFNS